MAESKFKAKKRMVERPRLKVETGYGRCLPACGVVVVGVEER